MYHPSSKVRTSPTRHLTMLMDPGTKENVFSGSRDYDNHCHVMFFFFDWYDHSLETLNEIARRVRELVPSADPGKFEVWQVPRTRSSRYAHHTVLDCWIDNDVVRSWDPADILTLD